MIEVHLGLAQARRSDCPEFVGLAVKFPKLLWGTTANQIDALMDHFQGSDLETFSDVAPLVVGKLASEIVRAIPQVQPKAAMVTALRQGKAVKNDADVACAVVALTRLANEIIALEGSKTQKSLLGKVWKGAEASFDPDVLVHFLKFLHARSPHLIDALPVSADIHRGIFPKTA